MRDNRGCRGGAGGEDWKMGRRRGRRKRDSRRGRRRGLEEGRTKAGG
jgi:hypothetical protein